MSLPDEVNLVIEGEAFVCRAESSRGIAVYPADEVPSEAHWYLYRPGEDGDWVADLGTASFELEDTEDDLKRRAVVALSGRTR